MEFFTLEAEKRNLVWKNYTQIVPATSEKISVFSVHFLKSRAAKAGLWEPRASTWPNLIQSQSKVGNHAYSRASNNNQRGNNMGIVNAAKFFSFL